MERLTVGDEGMVLGAESGRVGDDGSGRDLV